MAHCKEFWFRPFLLLLHSPDLEATFIFYKQSNGSYHPIRCHLGPVLLNQLSMPRVSFCYLDSLTMTTAIRQVFTQM